MWYIYIYILKYINQKFKKNSFVHLKQQTVEQSYWQQQQDMFLAVPILTPCDSEHYIYLAWSIGTCSYWIEVNAIIPSQ